MFDEPEGRSIQYLKMSSLEDLHRLARKYDTGIPKPLYRGQENYDWPLSTRLERDVPAYVIKETGLERYEYQTIIEAQRRLHHFMRNLPGEKDRASWLALLRHHGVPTRLLDVTRSFFIACYFAIRNAKSDKDAALWIFNRFFLTHSSAFLDWSLNADDSWLQSPTTIADYKDPYYEPFPKEVLSEPYKITLDKLRNPMLPLQLQYWPTLDAAMRGYIAKPGIGVAESFWMTRRMDVQQGEFLIPFNVRESFETNLHNFLNLNEESPPEQLVPTDPSVLSRIWSNAKVIKLRIPAAFYADIRTMLKSMNIRELTLFPDVEGALAHISDLIPINR